MSIQSVASPPENASSIKTIGIWKISFMNNEQNLEPPTKLTRYRNNEKVKICFSIQNEMPRS